MLSLKSILKKSCHTVAPPSISSPIYQIRKKGNRSSHYNPKPQLGGICLSIGSKPQNQIPIYPSTHALASPTNPALPPPPAAPPSSSHNQKHSSPSTAIPVSTHPIPKLSLTLTPKPHHTKQSKTYQCISQFPNRRILIRNLPRRSRLPLERSHCLGTLLRRSTAR
jgi:hypothetical protein